MNIGITGASGMLGTALLNRLSKECNIYATSRNKGSVRKNVRWSCFDLLDLNELKNWLEYNNMDIIIHCAAMVDVDRCEKDPIVAEKLHCITTSIISNHLNKVGGKLIYISTDSLFDGNKRTAYTENDETNPLSIYAKTKLAGEKIALNLKKNIALRTNIINYNGDTSNSLSDWIIKNLIENKPLNLFDDVFFSPLHVNDLSDIVYELIELNATGLYNATSSTIVSKFKFGLMIADIFNLDSNIITRGSIKDKKFVANRPCNMGLSSNKLAFLLNKKMPTVDKGIELLKGQYDRNKDR